MILCNEKKWAFQFYVTISKNVKSTLKLLHLFVSI